MFGDDIRFDEQTIRTKCQSILDTLEYLGIMDEEGTQLGRISKVGTERRDLHLHGPNGQSWAAIKRKAAEQPNSLPAHKTARSTASEVIGQFCCFSPKQVRKKTNN